MQTLGYIAILCVLLAVAITQCGSDGATRQIRQNTETHYIPAPYIPHWEYDSDDDALSGKKIKQAEIKSINTANFSPPYEGEQRATIRLQSHPRYGKGVIFSIKRGQFMCGVAERCHVVVRFDAGAPRKFRASVGADHSSTYVFIDDYASFVAALRKAKKLAVEATFFEQGAQDFSFDVDGLIWK